VYYSNTWRFWLVRHYRSLSTDLVHSVSNPCAWKGKEDLWSEGLQFRV